MSLQDITIKNEYRTLNDNIISNFYTPLLSQAVSYRRSVGFFSSTILSKLTYGISKLVQNGGTIQLIASPHLTEEDIQAITAGYNERQKILEQALLRELKEPKNKFEKERLNLLANLIADNKLDIKIAFTESGMYHEKMGIIQDADGNTVIFTGSMNETLSAIEHNYETIDVFCSWKDTENRIIQKIEAFENIWNGKENSLTTIDFPQVKEELIKKYQIEPPNYDIDELEEKEFYRSQGNGFSFSNKTLENIPTIPAWLTLHSYQKEAIDTWVVNKYRGIFDMATGTGKTFTGLSALTKCSQDFYNELAVIIVVPYQHLVEQWLDDIQEFNIYPIIGYSASKQTDWKDRLTNQIQIQNILLGRKNNFLCFLCTNATFATSFVQQQISSIKAKKLLIIDEAHNFGAKYLSKKLYDFYNFRLALSATINRHRDDEGTETLFGFFGKKCIKYDIERAINEGKLTKYRYYPIFVTLTKEEQIKYKQLTEEISKNIRHDHDGKIHLSQQGKIIAMHRARLIAGATRKIPLLKNKLEQYKNQSHILIYCGSTQQQKNTSDYSDRDTEGERQIETVSKLIGNELGIKCHHFTSKENITQRKEITRQFTDGDLQCIVAIKCLDEGVNIPKIKTAFILASTTNPKEYIQRRGRVLRLAEGKTIAEIYDFITIPFLPEEVYSVTKEEVKPFITLIKNELKRGYEFSRTAQYGSIAKRELDKIKEAYSIDAVSLLQEDEIYEFR